MWKKLLLVGVSSLLFMQPAFAENYQIDPVHSQVHFSVPHLAMFKVRGVFTQFSGQIEADSQSKTIQSVQGNIHVG